SSNRKNGEETEAFLTEESSTLIHAVVGTSCDPKALISVDPRTGSVLAEGRIKIRIRRACGARSKLSPSLWRSQYANGMVSLPTFCHSYGRHKKFLAVGNGLAIEKTCVGKLRPPSSKWGSSATTPSGI